MFDSIAPYYDLLNHLLSLNIDRYWRDVGVKRLLKGVNRGGVFLDLAAGTGDVAFTIVSKAPGARVVAVDPACRMLEILKAKSKKRGMDSMVFPVAGDGLSLPLPDSCCQGAMVAFGVRNIPHRLGALREMRRVICDGGTVVVLEFSKPKGIFGIIYDLYFHRVLPLLGRIISGDPGAYSYLPKTVEEFPSPAVFSGLMEKAGFSRVGYTLLTRGIVTCYWGRA